MNLQHQSVRPPHIRSRSPAPIKYKQRDERQNSFLGVSWPLELDATPERLVSAGFYYIGPQDRVKCAFCYGKLKRWQPHELPIEEHSKHFPECSFVQKIEKQTKVLTKNIRSKTKTSTLVSSEELKKQHDEIRNKTKRSSSRELWMMTLEKMGYRHELIHQAEHNLRNKRKLIELTSILNEIHEIERTEFLKTGTYDRISPSTSNDEHEKKEKKTKDNIRDEDKEEMHRGLLVMEKERDELENLVRCKVCLVNRIDTLFLTCRHFSTCRECAERVRDCPVFRQEILVTVDVFMV